MSICVINYRCIYINLLDEKNSVSHTETILMGKVYINRTMDVDKLLDIVNTYAK